MYKLSKGPRHAEGGHPESTLQFESVLDTHSARATLIGLGQGELPVRQRDLKDLTMQMYNLRAVPLFEVT